MNQSNPNSLTGLNLPRPIDIEGLEKAMTEKLTIGDKKQAIKPSKEKNAQPAAPKPVAEHPFARVDLRVGKIVKVEKHPAADRLFIETVDFEEEQPRTVISGLVGHCELLDLDGRLAVFICNLKPATLCKTLSSAMLLVAKDEASGQLEPLIVPDGAKAGDRIFIEGVIPQPDAVIKPKEDTWEKVRVELSMINGVAHYKDQPLLVADGRITSGKIPSGVIS